MTQSERIANYRKNLFRVASTHELGELDRFEVPYKRLQDHPWTADEAWIYATFHLGYDFREPEQDLSRYDTPPRAHGVGVGNCGTKALAAFRFTPDAHHPMLMYLTGKNAAHAITVYRSEGFFGSSDTSTHPDLGKREPIFTSLNDLLMTYKSMFSHYAILQGLMEEDLDRDSIIRHPQPRQLIQIDKPG